MRWLLLPLMLVWAAAAQAHKFDSAFLSVTEQDTTSYLVELKIPLASGRAAAVLDVRFPDYCITGEVTHTRRTTQNWRHSYTLQCRQPLLNAMITLDGMNPAVPNAVVALRFADGAEQILLIDAGRSAFRFAPGDDRHSARSIEYFPLGISHILGGPDHLLFVTGLLLVVLVAGAGTGTLIGTVTAFTIAHSITLALAVLGHVQLASDPVEILIALSILLLAVELSVARGRSGTPDGLTFRRPWLVAFIFGLAHGFGFAGALRETGLPEHALGLALLLFNLGVEAGQLLFVAALLALGALLGRLHAPGLPAARNLLVLGMGTLAAYWCLERGFILLI